MSLLRIKVGLGLFPTARKFENQRDALFTEYHEYLEYAQSEELSRFEYLKQYLNSPEFEEKENDPEGDPEEIALLKKEFATLHKSKRLKHYFKLKANETKFAPLKVWKQVFEEDFEGNGLDTEKWLTRYYWGDKILNSGYSLAGDQQCITDGKNISVSDSVLSIETRKEQAKGIRWNPAAGFIPCDFPYTSGVINTSKSFRFCYGKLEAKVKVPKGPAYHAFWLGGEKILPQINIFKYVRGKFYLENFWGKSDDPESVNKDSTAVSGVFAGKSCIFSLEWSQSYLVWAINGVVVKTVQRGVPNEPLYIAFGSGVDGKVRSLPRDVQFEIEWVRLYSKTVE
ncbi:MAG: family 16 glycosylhydrolase [Bacteroidales bacterium]|jgi:beta-glucanase (GH16 family)|nr:family 16 glycosylhydrolase [Bacteroidales bacterium]